VVALATVAHVTRQQTKERHVPCVDVSILSRDAGNHFDLADGAMCSGLHSGGTSLLMLLYANATCLEVSRARARSSAVATGGAASAPNPSLRLGAFYRK
jgi:hypothetical protein